MTRTNAALMLCASVLTACGTRPASDDPPARTVLRMAIDDHRLLSGFAGLPHFAVQAVTIGTSEKRLRALQDGSIDVASTVADVTYLGFQGRLPDRSAALDKVRGIALMGRVIVHLLIGPHANPNHGFRGMRVILGRPNGGNASLGERLVNSTGVATSEILGELLPVDAAVEKLVSGSADAMFETGRLPQEPVVQALRGGAHLVDIDGLEIDRLRESYPLLRRTVIPRWTYPGQDVPVHTVAIDLLLVCRADLSDEVVYELTRGYFEQFPENVRRATDTQRAPATVIPLHTGAARYYREREINR
jgi:TRAP transporter TAXI family solute receptor